MGLTWLASHCPSVLWHCCLGYLTRKIVSEMAYNVLGGTLNTTILLYYSLVVWCQDSLAVADADDIVVEEEAEDVSESSYTSATEDVVEDGAHGPNISQLKARREQLAKQVAEQVPFIVYRICGFVKNLILFYVWICFVVPCFIMTVAQISWQNRVPFVIHVIYIHACWNEVLLLTVKWCAEWCSECIKCCEHRLQTIDAAVNWNDLRWPWIVSAICSC